ncbi:MAG: hypothetical protein RLP09_34995 [Sandaracinaceae bacterium]
MTAAEAFRTGQLLLSLGVEVYRAWRVGETSKTVGEIFEGVALDQDHLDELERARFGDET